MMKRRSFVPAVRETDLPVNAIRAIPPRASHRMSVSRQLNFQNNAESKKEQFSTLRRFSHLPKVNESAVDHSVSLSQSIAESNEECTITIPSRAGGKGQGAVSKCEVRSQNSFSRVLKKTVITTVAQATSNNSVSQSLNVNSSIATSSQEPQPASHLGNVSYASLDTKIVKPKIFSNQKKSPVTELNTTAVFEEEEVAAFTATPHPDRFTQKPKLQTSVESSELADQMKLFLTDQRNVMQTMKLCFDKMNLVLDSQRMMNVEFTKLLSEMRNKTCCQSFEASKPVTSLQSIPEANHTYGANSVVASFEDDKENVAESDSFKPNAVFMKMKSNLNLKTPTVLKTVRPACVDTPTTILSNRVHLQLENLLGANEEPDE